MSTEDEDLFIPPTWIPARSQRALTLEHGKERGEKARQAKAEAVRAAELADRHLEAARANAEMNGQVVDPVELSRLSGAVTAEDAADMALVCNVGQTLKDVLNAAKAASDGDTFSKETRGDTWDYLDRPEPVMAGRSAAGAWPSSEFELDRQLEQARDLHHDLNMFRARYDYQGAETAARAKSDQRAMIYR